MYIRLRIAAGACRRADMSEGDRYSFAVAAIIGTRPEAIKMAPVLRELNRIGIGCTLVCTGQHPDLDLAGCGADEYGADTIGFDVRGLDADAMCDRIEALVSHWLARARPLLVLVQGDTNSALAAARAATRLGIPVGHVEAGLRTFDLSDPWPEERNRIEIDSLSTLLFAPTHNAADNLRAEQASGTIMVTGNSGVDALIDTADGAFAEPNQGKAPLILVTVHRRENRGAGVLAVGEALRTIARAEQVRFAIPLHPNRAARDEMIAATRGVPAATLLEPQSYQAMIALILRSRLVLTDSGGLQEECPALGRPVLILRNSTERPEAITSGNALLVGTDPEKIAAATIRLLRDPQAHDEMSVPVFLFGEPGASALIARAVRKHLEATPERRFAAAMLDHPQGAA